MKLEDDGSGDNKEEDIAIDEVQTDEESDDTQVSKSQTSRFANLQNIQFDFNPYDQDICILGSKGSGKSYLANIIMKGLQQSQDAQENILICHTVFKKTVSWNIGSTFFAMTCQ